MKRILILSTRFPYPLIDGVRIRIYNTAKYLGDIYEIDLLCLSYERVPVEHIQAAHRVFRVVDVVFVPFWRCAYRSLKSLFNGLPLQVNFFQDDSFARLVQERIPRYDLVIANHVRTVEYLRGSGIPKILDLHDSFSLRYGRTMERSKGLMSLAVRYEYNHIKPYETSVPELFDQSIIVSEVDRQYMLSLGVPHHKISTLNVAVRDDIRLHGTRHGRRIISFLGKMSYAPNVDAVEWFAHEIFPALHERYPDLYFYVIGATPIGRVQKLSRLPNIVVTGFIENPYDLLDESEIVIAPIRYGAGLQNKILEAMSIGKAVITTSIGAEGIDGQNGIHFYIADTTQEFIRRSAELLDDPPAREVIGKQACALIRERYTWTSLAARYKDLIRTLL